MKPEMLVIGADHSNTLGMIRALGKEKYTVNLIIHTHFSSSSGATKTMCEQSRFANGWVSTVSEEEKLLVQSMLKIANEKQSIRIVVFPTSDFAAYCIDRNYNLLSEKFILPSIDAKQGEIAKYMDKSVQKDLADQFGIKMADSMRINLESDGRNPLPNGWTYPVVLKPIVSAKGAKTDIVFVYSDEELINCYGHLADLGYKEILLQEFVQKDYELCVFGCITKESREAFYVVLKKLRLYPFEGGASLSYAVIDNTKQADSVVEMLKRINYSGMFDIDLFSVGDKVWLNEINFRNGGNAWAGVRYGLNTPVIWAEDLEGKKPNSKTHRKSMSYMDETADVHYVLSRKIGIAQWLVDLLQTRAFSKFWIGDLKGTLAFYRHSLHWIMIH